MRGASVAVLAGAMVALSATSAAPAPGPGTERVTLAATGEQGDGDSYGPQLSSDGRFAVFSGYASNLVPGDTNALADVFVRDLRKGTVERVNVGPDGAQADGDSSALAVSSDGRYVLFRSQARNLVDWETPPADAGAYDIYLHDRRTGTTERISVGLDGGSAYAGGAVMSADARYIAFNAKADRMEQDPGDLFGAVYVLDRRTGAVERISNRDRPSNPALLQAISADGRHVAYTQMVPRSSNGATWVHDRRTGTEERVNVRADGTPAERYALPASLSANGRTIAFQYWGDDLVPGETPGDDTHLYVRDLRTDVTRRVEPGPAGEEGPRQPVLSPDGRYLAYQADPRSADGRLGPANVYLRDLRTGTTRTVSESVAGGPVTDASVSVSWVSADARRIGLGSDSAQLVPGDTNGHYDGFVRRLR
ncbi:PD40 domain-containing protein [Streptomyces sp. TRM S81-3]|uniref:PD40 domain-containing protein n=1 Tax=Streptomyces griseicoloratus TaxID=2752516 RepID=A0A926QSH6_9ACTN|nr:PD40 domain-containing protein [Streptomyces griseicoloratus]MBD0421012.1 PD40 domain-containing protein [Streptomyces griseicoloratus]